MCCKQHVFGNIDCVQQGCRGGLKSPSSIALGLCGSWDLVALDVWISSAVIPCTYLKAASMWACTYHMIHAWILQAVRPCISFQVIKQISGVVLLLFLVMPRLVW